MTLKIEKKEKQLSIADFFKLDELSVQTKTKNFSTYFRQQLAEGLPVHRQILSPMKNIVKIKDNITGSVRESVMFGSNNYLGLANHPGILQKILYYTSECGIGLGGPPLLNGTTSLHKKLEKRIAALKHCEDALIYSSGFSANYGLISALTGKNDIIIMDELCHASLVDGTRASRSNTSIFLHNDVEDLKDRLEAASKKDYKNIFVIVEGVYSMDGDIPPLEKIYEVAKQYDAFIILDDAHGTGIMGDKSTGTAEHFGLEGKIDLVMGTFSKSLASSGGFIAGDKNIIDYLRFFSRTYFFSASMPPIIIAQIMASLDVMEDNPQLKVMLFNNVLYILNGLRAIGYDVNSNSPIIPVYAPESANIRELACQIDQMGVFVNHIEFPAVATNKTRFRISVMATHTKDDMDKLLSAFDSIKFDMIKSL